MKRLMLTYFLLFSLQILSSGLCYAAVTDPVVNALAKVNEYAEQGTTAVEDATTASKDYIDGKMGAMGDIQGAAKKAEKTKKKAAWIKKQADKAKKAAADAKRFAANAKAKVDEAKKFATDVKSKVDKAKSEVDKAKSDIDDAKAAAQGMKDMAGSALDQAKAKADNLQEKAGIESRSQNDVATQAAEALTKQSAQVAEKASAIGDLSMQAIPGEESLTTINALPSQEAVALSVDEVMSSAQNAPLVQKNIDNLEPVQGLSIAEINELGTLDIKAKQVLTSDTAKALKEAEDVEEAEDTAAEEDIDQENPNKVRLDPEAAAKLESKLQDIDAKKRMELKAFHSGRKAFAAPADRTKQLGGRNE